MELSVKERLLLANQYLILQRVDPSEEKHYEELVKILQNGFAAQYGKLSNCFSDEMSVEDCREVSEILEMFRHIDSAIRKDPSAADPRLKFRGFDAHEEPTQFSYAQFLIEYQRRWTESAIDDLNSHYPNLPEYREMLRRWNESQDKHHLTPDDLTRIVG